MFCNSKCFTKCQRVEGILIGWRLYRYASKVVFGDAKREN